MNIGRPCCGWGNVAIIGLALGAGCSRGLERLAAPEWDPSQQAEQAMQDTDADGDGQLQAAELTKAPGLAAGAKHIDQNGDGALSSEEIKARLEQFRESRVAIRSPRYVLKYRGRPLVDAEVSFVPEPFLKDVIEPAHGTTDASGIVVPMAAVRDVAGLRPGYYRIQVTSPQITLPAKFNSATTVGVEVALPTDPWVPYGAEELQLAD
jgi:hypothetical protein